MTELKIDGMSCTHCQTAVQRALERVAGVDAATVDLKTGRAKVEGDADVEALLAAVRGEGYQAAPHGS